MEKLSLAEPTEGQDFKVGDDIYLLDWKGPVNRDVPPPAAQPEAQPTEQLSVQPTEQPATP